MKPQPKETWELLILDAHIPGDEQLCLGAGDIDGDGYEEIVTGGNSNQAALVWYRPATREKCVVVKEAHYHVGMAIEDIDGDGIKEIFVGEENPKGSGVWAVVFYKPEKDLRLP